MPAARPRGGGGTSAPARSCARGLDLALEVAPLADASLGHAPAGGPLGQEGGSALGARLRDRSLPDHERARGIGRAAVEDTPAPAAPGHELTLAVGLGTGDAQGHRLGGLALRVAGAGDELSVAAVLDDHRLAARGTDLVGGLVRRALVAAEVPGVAAIRIGGAGQELAEAAPALQEGLAAFGARLTRLGSRLDVAHLLLGPPQIGL